MINITGASESRVAPLAAELIRDYRNEYHGQSLIVVPTLTRAKRLATDLAFFHGQMGIDEQIYVLPPEEDGLIAFEARNNDDLMERLLRARNRK